MLSAVLAGLFGGFLGELINIYEHRKEDPQNWPRHLRMPSYWVISSLMVMSGGGLAAVYEGSLELSPLLALNVGLTAPLIIKTAGREAPAIAPGEVD